MPGCSFPKLSLMRSMDLRWHIPRPPRNAGRNCSRSASCLRSNVRMIAPHLPGAAQDSRFKRLGKMLSNKRQQHQASVLRVLQTKDETRAFYDKISGVSDLLAEHSEGPVRQTGL